MRWENNNIHTHTHNTNEANLKFELPPLTPQATQPGGVLFTEWRSDEPVRLESVQDPYIQKELRRHVRAVCKFSTWRSLVERWALLGWPGSAASGGLSTISQNLARGSAISLIGGKICQFGNPMSTKTGAGLGYLLECAGWRPALCLTVSKKMFAFAEVQS